MATADERDAGAVTTYDEVTERYRQYLYLQHAGMVVGWDQQVMMPDGGAPARAKQLGALSTVGHDLLTDDELGDRLDRIDETELDDDQRAVVREIRRDYERSASVPSDLITRLSEYRSENQGIWQEAKAEDDYETFAPRLDGLVDLERERSAAIAPDRDPYEVQYEDRQPYLPLERVEEIFAELR